MHKQDGVKWPFRTEELADNLIEWAMKMKALGEVLGALSWYENRGGESTETLENCGEALGGIISDYAGLIEDTINENMINFVDSDKTIVFPLARYQEVYDFIGQTRRPEDLCVINLHTKELSDFVDNVAVPAMRLKNGLEALKKEILAKQKSTPAAVSAAAGA